MTKQPWALILGASSGFGEATAIELARAGMNICGVHMDRRDKLPHVADVQERIRALGRECEFYNFNAADEDKRKECVEQIRVRLAAHIPHASHLVGPIPASSNPTPTNRDAPNPVPSNRDAANPVPSNRDAPNPDTPKDDAPNPVDPKHDVSNQTRDVSNQSRDREGAVGFLRVVLHSLAWGALKPLAGAQIVANKKQIESTADIMGHSLVYWVQECLAAGLLDKGTRIFAMTSSGGTRAIPEYGPVSAAKAILEAHIRQLALELAPAGITANAILAGVTDTPALRLIPGHEKLMEIARLRNPHKRLTTPEDVGRCIAALCHPATYWMTGNTIHVDGGENIVG